MERDNKTQIIKDNTFNFNSHAHVERDTVRIAVLVINHISTHTLTWSVTSFLFFCHLLLIISTHTLTWSVTIIAVLFVALIIISTHTLTWSVTYLARIDSHNSKISTHTLTWSVTLDVEEQLEELEFQLTRSRGA